MNQPPASRTYDSNGHEQALVRDSGGATVTLQPAQSQVLVLPLAVEPTSAEVTATVAADVVECDAANNTDVADPACIPAG